MSTPWRLALAKALVEMLKREQGVEWVSDAGDTADKLAIFQVIVFNSTFEISVKEL